MKVAVTGGTGCLGRPLIEKLVKMGLGVKVLSSGRGTSIAKFGKRVRMVSGTLASVESLKELTRDCEIVFHLAAKVHSIPKRRSKEDEFYNVNVEGTGLLLEASSLNSVKKMVFYSTVGVYGQDSDFHGDESSPCEPRTTYAVSKYLAEQLVLNDFEKNGLEAVVLRFPVVYGPLDRGNVAALIGAIYHKYFFHCGDGECLRSMISSENTAEAAIKAALETSGAGQVFCVTDGKDYTLEEIVETICRAMKRNWRPVHVPLPIAELVGKFGGFFEKITGIRAPLNSEKVTKLSRSLTFSCEKAQRILRYEPTETLFEGLSREIQWLKSVYGWN